MPDMLGAYIRNAPPAALAKMVYATDWKSEDSRSLREGGTNGLVAQFGSAVALQAKGYGIVPRRVHENYAFQSKPGDWTRLKPGVAQSDSEGRHE